MRTYATYSSNSKGMRLKDWAIKQVEEWDYILKHPKASYQDIVRGLNLDDYTMGSLEGVESIENPVMIKPYKDEVYPAVEAVVLQYIQDKGWM
jgi:hypothetical protein